MDTSPGRVGREEALNQPALVQPASHVEAAFYSWEVVVKQSTLLLYHNRSCWKRYSWKRWLSSACAHRSIPMFPGMLLHIFPVHKEKPVAELSMSQTLNTINECDETLPLPVTNNVLQCDFRFSTFLQYQKNVMLELR